MNIKLTMGNILSNCHYHIGNKPITIVLLHGYLNKARKIVNIIGKDYIKNDYNVLYCDAHTKLEHINQWSTIAGEYIELLNRYENIYLIGHSFGGSLALFLSKHPHVKRVYSISAFNNEKVLINQNTFRILMYSFLRLMKKEYRISDNQFEDMKSIMVAYNEFSDIETQKIHLYHGKLDYIVPIEQFYENKKKLRLPNERCFVSERDGHESIIQSKKVRNMIFSDIANS